MVLEKDRLQMYVQRILNAIQEIERYNNKMTLKEFEQNAMAVDACLMQLIHIWETANKIHKKFPKFDKIPHTLVIWLRNFIAHDYTWVRRIRIRKTIKEDLPVLKKDLFKWEK